MAKGDTYFVISWGKGVTEIGEMDVVEIERELADESLPGGQCLSRCPDEPDTNYWPEGGTLIIKGKIVVPRPVKVVERYEIE